jgi:aspartyl protease family protein
LISLFIFSFSQSLFAIDKVEVQGLFSNKAVLLIDGQRHILKVGDTSPEGVKVVSANSRGAVLEIDGKQQEYKLGNTVSTEFKRPDTIKESVYRNSSGMYLATGLINGRSVRFLVDTGATTIAMNSQHARQLGIRYELVGKPVTVTTASGVEKAYKLYLKNVRLGRIVEDNVEAVVLEGSHPATILLGMSFLKRLNVKQDDSAMVLVQGE